MCGVCVGVFVGVGLWLCVGFVFVCVVCLCGPFQTF